MLNLNLLYELMTYFRFRNTHIHFLAIFEYYSSLIEMADSGLGQDGTR